MIKDVVDTILNLVKAPPAEAMAAAGPEATEVAGPVAVEAAEPDAFADRLQAMANDPALQGTPLVAGSLELVGLEDIRDALGDAWEQVAETAKTVAEAELQLQLGEADVYRHYDAFSYVVCFADLDKAEAAVRAGNIALKLKAKLIFQIPQIAEVIGVEHFITDIDREALRRGGTSLTERLFETLRQVRTEARETARRTRQALLRDIQLQFAPAWHTSKHVVVLNRCLLDQTSGTRTLAQFQAMADPQQIDQTLAELDCMLLTKAIETLHHAASSRPSGALLIPVSYRTLNNARWCNEYRGLLQMMPDTYRKLLILEIGEMPAGVSPARLGELIEQMTPYVKGVSLEVAIDHPDLETILEQGSWALAVNITGSQSADPQVPMRLKRFAGAATAARTISLAHGANSMGLALAAVDAGFSYVDGPAIHPTMREPKVPSQLHPLTNASLAKW
jgi:hypothetical protein